jgi:hypothetical protein
MTMIASSNREIERNHGTDQEIKGWNQAISQWFNILSGHGFNNFLSFFFFFFYFHEILFKTRFQTAL